MAMLGKLARGAHMLIIADMIVTVSIKAVDCRRV
jgi:hypothetical protein